MDTKEYKKQALRTNSPDYQNTSRRVTGGDDVIFPRQKQLDLLHASLGLVTESAEFQDMLKKHIFYGKPLDEVNLKEEIGDILWYCAIALEALGTDFESVMQTNINKLKARYPQKFTEDNAINRDLKTERSILEK
jgi:NTP pyrophosphatase (non-canonical NTP hydrolase)